MMQDVVSDAPVELRLDYELSRDEYRAAQHDVTQHLLRSIPSSGIAYALAAATVLCGIIIGMGYAELVNGYFGKGWRWKWFIALALLGLGLITIWQQRLRTARIAAAITPDDSISLGPQTVTLTREGLTFAGRATATQVAWPALKGVVQGNGNLLIILNNYSFFGVPDRAFADAPQRALWLAALREHAPHATIDSTPISATKRAVVMPTDPAQPAPPPAAAPMAVGLRENLRAGGRLAFFQRVAAGDFVATAEAFIALVAMELLVQLAFDVANVNVGAGAGIHGQFNYDDLPQALLFVPLTLMFGVAAARRAGDRSLLLALPVALVAAGLVISLVGGVLGLMLQHKIIALAARHWRWLFYGELLWWCAIIAFACWRCVPARPLQSQHRASLAVLGVALLAAPLLWNSAYHLWIAADEPESTEAQRAIDEKYFALANEKGFYAQQDLLAHALSALQPERPGVVDVYTLTAGLYASEDVFMKEVMLIDTLLRKRFDAEGRSLMLINNAKTVHDTPLASATSLSAALKHIGELMNVDEDVLVLYVSSHGSQKHELAVDFWPLRLQTIDPPALKAALDESKIKWKVLVVSACYSGGFVEPLKDEHTLIITASSATKTSFGCGHESDATYLATALFDEALRKTYSFETAFEAARKAIRTREQAQGFEASDPQMFVGAAIREKLLQVEKRLSAPTQ